MVTTALALGVTALTLIAFTGIGILYSRRHVGSIEDLITARNSTGQGATAATLFATGTGAWILFTPAEAGAVFGGVAAVLGYAMGSAIASAVYILLGVRIREIIPEGHSLTEYVYVRFGAGMYSLVVLVTVSYMFLFLAAELTGAAQALALVAAVPQWQTILLISGFVLVYTVYGGLIASIVTDTIQTLIIIPLFTVSLVGAILALGGLNTVRQHVAKTDPTLLDPTYLPGLEFGVYVSLGLIAVGIFHQGYWQRVFAARTDRAVRRGFGITAVASVPTILLPGFFGLAAVGLGLVGSPSDGSIAFFLVLHEAFPEWIVLGVVLVTILFVMSTADTLFNAIASIVTADLPLVLDDPDEQALTVLARGVTVVVGIGALGVALQGYSVLELLLFANLLATATVFPFVYGLYSRQITQFDALVSSVAGLVGGVAMFPISRGFVAPVIEFVAGFPDPSFLLAYTSAAGISSGGAILLTHVTGGEFDFDRLAHEIQTLDTRSDESPENHRGVQSQNTD